MSIKYSPPHVVHFAYAQSCVGPNIEDMWMKLSNEVYVIEQRLEPFVIDNLSLASFTLNKNGTIKRVGVKDLYKPVYFGQLLKEMPGWQDTVGEPSSMGPEPIAWWLRLDLVDPSERIRFPALPAKVNMTEWRNMGELRELYSFDGFGFTLRDQEWGRQ